MATNQYDDIIHLSRPVSERHAPMSRMNRSAQFAPFAALAGYEDMLRETARLTEEQTCLDEHDKELLDRKLRYIAANPAQTVTFLCFRRDERKSGGSYVPIIGRVKKIDLYRRTVLMEDGQEFGIEDIRAIEGVNEGEL